MREHYKGITGFLQAQQTTKDNLHNPHKFNAFQHVINSKKRLLKIKPENHRMGNTRVSNALLSFK